MNAAIAATTPAAPTLGALAQWLGRELGTSDWVRVNQHMIDIFAAVTGDKQWLHVDMERARRGPFGGTLAHGWLLAALLAPWTLDALTKTVGCEQALNYGVDKLRFLAPVRGGARVRGRIVLAGVEPRGQGNVLLMLECTMELEGSEKPALVATALVLLAVA